LVTAVASDIFLAMHARRSRALLAGLLTAGLAAAALPACSSNRANTDDAGPTGGQGGGNAGGGQNGGAGQSGAGGTAGSPGGPGGRGGSTGTGGTSSGAGGRAGASGRGGATTSGTGGVGPGAGGSPGTGGGSNPGLPAGDEFNGTALDPSWTVFNPTLVTVSEGQGNLLLRAVGDSFWYQGNQGVLVYKLVTGDFKATTTVHVSKGSDPTMPPVQNIELVGLMARNPTGATENYVLIVIGFAEMGHIAVEHKETTNNVSVFGETPWPVDAELRICRVGSAFTLLRRTVGTTTWTVDYQTTRTDLPATLQVGPNLYDHHPASDLLGAFDRFAFEPVGAGCTQ
jgi:hypothetical protein